MPDDKRKRGTPDRSRINLTEANDVRYWTREFRISAEQLQRAMDAVGTNSTTRVREFLKTSGMG